MEMDEIKNSSLNEEFKPSSRLLEMQELEEAAAIHFQPEKISLPL